jgi:hypothetical protein
LKSSDISSTKKTLRPPSATPPRETFALTGPSVALDPLTHAVRPDLADVRLATQVFAPHYVQPIAMIATRAVPLLASNHAESQVLGALAAGDVIDVLEIADSYSWGQRQGDGIVGYIATDALRQAAMDGGRLSAA